jgi:hypothetical protein
MSAPAPAAKAGLAARDCDWWQHEDVAGLRITYVPAQHFSAPAPATRCISAPSPG